MRAKSDGGSGSISRTGSARARRTSKARYASPRSQRLRLSIGTYSGAGSSFHVRRKRVPQAASWARNHSPSSLIRA